MATGERGRLYLVPARERTDAELVAAFLRGEPSASAEIWERYYTTVRRIVFRSVGPAGGGQDPDDLIQEVFMRLYRKLPALREQSSLRAFVLAITVRVVK